MLDIAIPKLVLCASQQMFADEQRFGMNDSHGVLKLISKSECAARLIISAACPKAGSQCLVEQPPIAEQIQCCIGSFQMQYAECAVPVCPDVLERMTSRFRPSKAKQKFARCFRVTFRPQRENNFPLLTFGEIQ